MDNEYTQWGCKIVEAVERERRGLGNLLHDQLCQTLAGTVLIMESVGRAVAEGRPVSSENFLSLKKVLESAIHQSRSLSQRFSPVSVEGAGLLNALQTLAAESPGCEFICEYPVLIRDRDIALALFRVAQEAVQNAVSHASALSILVELTRVDSEVTIRVRDNGRGFVPGESGTPGIDMMRLHAELLQGTLTVKTKPGRGTEIVARLPLER
jgi:signal transduction histidine kinase